MIEGRHVRFMGRGGDPAKLGSVEGVRGIVAAIVQACGMRLLGEVHTYDVAIEIDKLKAEAFEDEGGVTAIGVLSTSHVAIHTWPARAFFVLDVYSCRTFEPGRVSDLLFDAFVVLWDGARVQADPAGRVRYQAPRENGRGPAPSLDFYAVDRSCAGMTIREVDLSFGLDMPEAWKEPLPDFGARC